MLCHQVITSVVLCLKWAVSVVFETRTGARMPLSVRHRSLGIKSSTEFVNSEGPSDSEFLWDFNTSRDFPQGEVTASSHRDGPELRLWVETLGFRTRLGFGSPLLPKRDAATECCQGLPP